MRERDEVHSDMTTTEPPTPAPGPAATPEVTKPELPTQLMKDWVYYVVGFGVAVGIGLAVWLGKVGVPLFSPLLDIIPNELRPTLIPLSSALMGVVAVVVQYYADRKGNTDRLFAWGLAFTVAAFIALVIVRTKLVVPIETTPGTRVTFLVCLTVPNKPPCVGVGKAECIERLTFNPTYIRSFFGDSCLENSELGVQAAYLAFMAAFGLLVGIVIARRKHHQQSQQTPPDQPANTQVHL
jgi:hypothetical protein